MSISYIDKWILKNSFDVKLDVSGEECETKFCSLKTHENIVDYWNDCWCKSNFSNLKNNKQHVSILQKWDLDLGKLPPAFQRRVFINYPLKN